MADVDRLQRRGGNNNIVFARELSDSDSLTDRLSIPSVT